MKKILSLLGVALLAGLAFGEPVVDAAAPQISEKEAKARDADAHLTSEVLMERSTGIWKDTGIYGFTLREAPEWATQGYTRKDGQFVPGHEVEILGGLPYGVGQLIMIPVCLLLIYLAIVKEFEPLLLLPIGLGGLLANIPFDGRTDGAEIFNNSTCTGCHTAGVGGAPKLEAAGIGARLAEQGIDTLVSKAISGFQGTAGVMPAKGGNPALTDEQIKATVEWMVAQSK